MLTPNQYTLTEKSITYGLHRHKDGKLEICQQSRSGDWATVKPATAREIEYFTKYGKRAV